LVLDNSENGGIMKKKYSIPIKIIIGVLVVISGYLSGLSIYFMIHAMFLLR
jgi:hypothetical protein